MDIPIPSQQNFEGQRICAAPVSPAAVSASQEEPSQPTGAADASSEDESPSKVRKRKAEPLDEMLGQVVVKGLKKVLQKGLEKM